MEGFKKNGVFNYQKLNFKSKIASIFHFDHVNDG